MQLRTARLCLDCEEIHEEGQCPICASEAFVFLTRWIPVDERRGNRRRPPHPPIEPKPLSQWMKRGAAGLALVAAGRWLWQSTRPVEWSQPPTGRGTAGSSPEESK